MAYSRVQYTQTVAGNKTFVIPFPYLQRANIQVSDDGAVVTYTYVDAQTILLDVAPDVGSVVDVRRITPTEILVDYTDGSTLGERELDLTYRQTLFLSQEAIDKALDALQLGTDGTYDALGHRIKNLGTPVNPSDAVTKAYADSLLSAIQNQVDLAAGYAANAANSAADAASQVALAQAQVALAAAQVALAEAAVDDAAGYAVDAANQVALAANQVALAEAAAADAASQVLLAADQVGLAAAQVALAAGYAADAAAAQAGAEAAEGGAIAVLDEINDKINTGELGSYPGVMDGDPLNQDMRRAWASLSSTEKNGNVGGQFEDLTTANGKGILTPSLGNYVGKRILQVNSASPARLEYDAGWKYAKHDDPFNLTNINSDADGRPILLVPGSSEIGIVIGKLPGEYYVDPSTLAGGTVLAGHTKVGFAKLKSIPYDSSGQAEVYHSLLYQALIGNNTTSFIGTGPDWFECIQEVTIEYTEDAAPTNRIIRKFVRHVKGASDSSFYGNDWQPVGGGGGGSLPTDPEFNTVTIGQSLLRMKAASSATNYIDSVVAGADSDNMTRKVTSSDGVTYELFGGFGDTKRSNNIMLSDGLTTGMNRRLAMTGTPGSNVGEIYIDNRITSTSQGNHRLTLSNDGIIELTTLRTKSNIANAAESMMYCRSNHAINGPSWSMLWLTPHTTTALNASEYTTVGAGNINFSDGSAINCAYSRYFSQPSNTARAGRVETLVYKSTSGTLAAGHVAGIGTTESTNLGASYTGSEVYSKLLIANSFSGKPQAEVGARYVGSTSTESFTYSSAHRAIVTGGIIGGGTSFAHGSYEIYCGLSTPAAGDYNTAASYSNGKQGQGICLFNTTLVNTSIGIRLSSRWNNSAVNTAVGVLSSDHAGAPGETAGVAPLRFEQTLTAGGTTRVWTAANTTIGTDAQNPSTFNDTNKTLTTITRMGKNRKMVTIRQRTLVPDVNGIITITLPESYKNLISVAFVPDQPDLMEPSVSFAYIPDSFSMASGTSRSTVSLGFLEVDAGIVAIANSAEDCAGLITLVLEE